MKHAVHNLVFLTGSTLAFYGIWLLSPAVAYLVTGVFIVALAVLAAPSKGK